MTISANVKQDTETVYHTCPLCEATCGLAFTVENGGIVRISGDHEDVFSRGYFCPKGAALGELHHDPDRLRKPRVRDGDSWKEVSWDEAFAAVENGFLPIIEKYGRDAVAVFLGNPNAHTMAGATYMRPLLKALKSKNIYSSSSVDQIPKHVSAGLMFGSPLAIPIPDIDRTDYLLILGANPLASNGSLCTAPDFPGRLQKIKNRGGKIVVIDPCRTKTAKLAHDHHFIRPGTDPLFLFAVVNVLFDENRIALGRLADHVTGLQMVNDLSAPFTPDAVSAGCGIEADTIRRIARELADAPSATVYGRMGTSTVQFGTLANWLVDVINVLTGNLDRPGGAMFPAPAHVPAKKTTGGKGFRTGRWRSGAKGLPEVIGEFPVAALADEIETSGDGRIRALLTIAGNPVISTPNSARLDAALDSLDFMVAVDFYLNETTRHADVILPPTSPLSHSQYDFFFYGLSVRNIVNYSPPVVEPGADEMDKWRILARLAMIFSGMGAHADPALIDDFVINLLVNAAVADETSTVAGRPAPDILAALANHDGPDRILDFLLRTGPYGDGFGTTPGGLSLAKLKLQPHGIDLGPLQSRVPEILATKSGKIELSPETIREDVERLKVLLNASPVADTVLIGRRHLRSNNSWLHNLPKLIKGKPRCTLQLHPEDADRLGIQDGGVVKVSSRVGSIEAPAEITDDIMPGVVSLPHGWGHDLPGIALSVASAVPGVNSNVLTDEEQMDPLSGNAVLNGIPVTVSAL